MRHIILILTTLMLHGCGVYECLDVKLERPVQPINKDFKVELEFQDQKMNMTVRCERYYDAICAERGNYWAIREVGYKSQYQTNEFRLNDDALGEVRIPIPYCTKMVGGKKQPLEHIVPSFGGEHYWLRSSKGTLRTYGSGKKTITVNLSIKVNGEPVE